MNELKCYKCSLLKDISLFTKNKKKKNGVNGICKECHSEYRTKHYRINKEKVIRQVNDYRTNNPEKYPVINRINKQSKKAGRTIQIDCIKCTNKVFVNQKDIDTNIKKYCSKECRQKDCKSSYHYYIKNVKRRAFKIKKEFSLDEIFLKTLLEIKQQNKCAVTGIDIFIKHPSRDVTTINDTASLDRIDSTKGYTQDNVQWVALGINYMKMDFTTEELHKMLSLIKENYTYPLIGVTSRFQPDNA